jgi:hypothetical protein
LEALVKFGNAAATRKRQSGIRSDQPSSGFERQDIKIPKKSWEHQLLKKQMMDVKEAQSTSHSLNQMENVLIEAPFKIEGGKMDTRIMLTIALTLALATGLSVVPAIELQQQAETKGCAVGTPAANSSKTRCVHP